MNDIEYAWPWVVGILGGVAFWGLCTFLAYLPWGAWS